MLAIQNLQRRKLRTFFALLGIAVGISAVVSIVSMAKGLRSQFYRIADQFAFDLIVQSRGAPQPLVSQVALKDKEHVLTIPGVKAVSLLALHLTFQKDESKSMPILILGLEPEAEVLARYEILRGRRLVPEDKNAILLGELSAKQLNLDVGGTFSTRDSIGDYTVVGIFRPPVEGVDLLSGQAIANLNYLHEQLELKPNLMIIHLRTGAEARLAPADALDAKGVDAATAKIAAAMAETKGLKKLEVKPMKGYIDSFKQVEIVDKFAWAMSCLAALVGGIGIANTMLMSVFERTREIGLLRAVGWSRTSICTLVVTEGLVLSLLGGILGIPLGLLEIWAATRVVEMGWIQVTVSPVIAFDAISLAVVIGVAGSLYPGLRAANLEPTEALRYE